MVGIYELATEKGSGAMIYIPSFIKIGSGIQNVIAGDTQTGWRSHKPTLIFQIKKDRKDGRKGGNMEHELTRNATLCNAAKRFVKFISAAQSKTPLSHQFYWRTLE
jgi:hypothetical protein